jgi:pyruvate formate lyase activating enzyme
VEKSNEIMVAGFIKNSFVDYPSKIASVIFLGGCNFVCHYCHNNHILPGESNTMSFASVISEIKEQVGFIDAVVVSGGEPTLHAKLYEIIKAIRGLGLLVKLDTNGTNSAMLQDLVEKGLVDYVAMDVKAPIARYGDIAGVTNPKVLFEVEASIAYLKEQTRVDYMFRTTLSPVLTTEDIKNLGVLIDGARCFQLQQFVPNDFSKSHKVVMLPYSEEDARMFGVEFAKHCANFILRGF